MSRRLILVILVVLIVGVTAGTVVLVVQRLRGEQTPPTGGDGADVPQLNVADEGTQRLAEENPNGDNDGDGLTNAEELTWRTDANSPDTDGDGFRDGDEVRSNHNPTIAGPNDALPDNFDPTQDLQALDVAPLQVDQYFEPGLDLYAEKPNLTEEFAKGRSETDVTAANMMAFAQSQTVITKLPTVQESAVQTTTDNSPLTMGLYLNQARNIQRLSDAQALSSALTSMYENSDTSRIEAMALEVRQYQQALFNQKAPSSAASLHKLLLGYTELLAATLDEVALWNSDPIRSMVALQQLDKIDRQYYPLITKEIQRLAGITGS